MEKKCTNGGVPTLKANETIEHLDVRHILLKSLWLLLYPVAAWTVNWFRNEPQFVEQFFSQGIYPSISAIVGGMFSIFPFSFAEMLFYGICILLLWFVCHFVVRAAKHQWRWRPFLNWLLIILIVGGAGINLFYWMWGFNYFRTPLAERIGLDTTPRNPEQLESLCLSLAEAADRLRSNLPEDADGVFSYPQGKAAALDPVPSAYKRLGERLPEFARKVFRAKPVVASELLSYAGISGIYIPFTEEANVNIDDPSLLIGSSAAHETAHFLGIASEDEANFVAFLACLSSDDPSLRYSGFMLALVHAGNALSRSSPSAYNALWASYSDELLRDLDQYNAYLNAHQGKTAEHVSEMNDNYLKANGQTEGIASYGQMVDLLLDLYYFEQSGVTIQ